VEDISNSEEAGKVGEVNMQHGFSQHDWLAYLEGRLSEQATIRIDRHLTECAECAEFVERTREWERQILSAARAIKEDRFAAPERVEELLMEAIGRLGTGRPARIRPIGAILVLRRLLEPLLGRRVAEAFVDLAIRRSALTDAAELEPQTWPAFVEQLCLAAESLGGINTQRMIKRAGARMAAEMI
jgi:anti-sigma factor RsiW